MKFYKIIPTSKVGQRDRHIVVFNNVASLLATPDKPQILYYFTNGEQWIASDCMEVQLEDIKYLIPHFPKIIKKELGYLK